MPKNKSATRYFSDKQETYIAKLLGGTKVPNSGAIRCAGGDVRIGNDWLIECKTSMKPKESFSIKKEWIDKNERERMDLQIPYSALVFQFEEDGTNYFVLDEKTFKKMKEVFNG